MIKKQYSAQENILVFLLLEKKFEAWVVHPEGGRCQQKMNGDERTSVNSAADILDAYRDLVSRSRNGDNCYSIVHWIADEQGRKMLVDFKCYGTISTTWQILAWEWLQRRFGLDMNNGSPWDSMDHISGVLFPWMVAVDASEEREQMLEALNSEHLSESAKLAAERNELKKANQKLREQNRALQNIDAESMVRFLPALFPRVFTAIGASDLALLCGRVEPFVIPNPFPEPSEETLDVLQHDFRLLPREKQEQIIEFMMRAPQLNKLKPRQEVRDIVNELKRGLAHEL